MSTLETSGKLNSQMGPVPGGRYSIVVSIPASYAGYPSSIPGNGELCGGIVMSHPEGYDPRVPIRGLLHTLGTRGKLNSDIGPWTQY